MKIGDNVELIKSIPIFLDFEGDRNEIPAGTTGSILGFYDVGKVALIAWDSIWFCAEVVSVNYLKLTPKD